MNDFFDRKPYAISKFLYCVNTSCEQKEYCANYFDNYNFSNKHIYSFTKFTKTSCPFRNGDDTK